MGERREKGISYGRRSVYNTIGESYDLVTALLKNCGCNSQFTQMVISTIEGDQVMSGGMINHHLSEQPAGHSHSGPVASAGKNIPLGLVSQ